MIVNLGFLIKMVLFLVCCLDKWVVDKIGKEIVGITRQDGRRKFVENKKKKFLGYFEVSHDKNKLKLWCN